MGRRNPDPNKNFLWTARTSRTDSYGLIDESWKLIRNRGYMLTHAAKQKNYYLHKGSLYVGVVRFTDINKPTNPEYLKLWTPNWIFLQGIGKDLTLKTKLALQDMCVEWKDSLVYWDMWAD